MRVDEQTDRRADEQRSRGAEEQTSRRTDEQTSRRKDKQMIRSDEGLTLETSAFESLYGGQSCHIINPIDKTKLSKRTKQRAK